VRKINPVAKYGRQPGGSSDTPPARITREGLREAARLFAYLLPYRGRFAGALICLLVASLMGLAFPFFTGRLIDSAQHGPSGANWPLVGMDINAIAGLLILVLAVQAGCSFIQTYWLAQAGERSLADLRRDTYARLIRLPMTFFGERRVGELSARI